METTMNAYHIKVNMICASCKHKECMGDGTRVCQKMGLKVEQKYVCRQWEMADGLKNAGLQNGGAVRLKGTHEIVIC
jgi:hypothetical protein